MNIERLERLAKERGIRKVRLCSEVKNDYLMDCEEKDASFPEEYIIKWAELLDTTPEYLKGETDQKERIPFDELLKSDPEAKEFFDNFMMLYKQDPAKFYEVANYMRYKVDQKLKEENKD